MLTSKKKNVLNDKCIQVVFFSLLVPFGLNNIAAKMIAKLVFGSEKLERIYSHCQNIVAKQCR